MIALMGRFGRLGNQLWTYGNVLAYAMRTGARVINPAFQAAKSFKGTIGLAPDWAPHHIPLVPGHAKRLLTIAAYKMNLRARLLPFVQLGEENLLDMDMAAPVLAETCLRSPLVFLSGFYFHAPVSLETHKAAVVQFFSLIEPLQARVNALATLARGTADILIGVHMRHGDYRTYCNGVMYYSTAEYCDVMHSLSDQFPGKTVAFLVCSDERQTPEKFSGLRVTLSSEVPVVDMYTLAECDYVFGPNSSFSHWASFVGDVPLHVLDWRAATLQGAAQPIYQPDVTRHFRPFTPWDFGKYAARHVSLHSATQWRRGA